MKRYINVDEKRTTVYIPVELKEFVKDYDINLSYFVREQLYLYKKKLQNKFIKADYPNSKINEGKNGN